MHIRSEFTVYLQNKMLQNQGVNYWGMWQASRTNLQEADPKMDLHCKHNP